MKTRHLNVIVFSPDSSNKSIVLYKSVFVSLTDYFIAYE